MKFLAGKSTILYKLKLDETLNTIPTVGFNVETIKYKKMNLNVWDVGGQDSIRSLWRHYYTGTHVSIPESLLANFRGMS